MARRRDVRMGRSAALVSSCLAAAACWFPAVASASSISAMALVVSDSPVTTAWPARVSAIAEVSSPAPVLGGLTNGDFESAPGPNGMPPGWVIDVGARNGANLPASNVEVDASTGHGVGSSLHLSGDDSVRAWRTVKQEIEARPGAKYELSAFTKTSKVRRENVRGTTNQQFPNCYVGLFFYDDAGAIVARQVAQPTLPGAPWEEIKAEIQVPDTVRRAEVCAFLSMSGDLWVDDVAVVITGGRALPKPEVLVNEGFEKASAPPQGWVEDLGASNGGAGRRSKIEIDPRQGHGDSPRSLHVSGDANTTQWWMTGRSVDVTPGDVLNLSAMVKAIDVRPQGSQFQNFHLNLSFTDAAGKPLGSMLAKTCGQGTFDWKPVELEALAPAGAARVRLGVFLSMSGDAWIDRVQLTRRPGSAPAYDGWLALESKHVIVRYPKDHPRADGMRAHAARLDAAYEASRRSLSVSFDDKITVYLYADKEQGQRFTGRPLAFASPSERAVHQTLDNTIGHELTHVVALGIGYSQVALFGEGIAVWLDGEPGEVHHSRAAALLRESKLPTLDTLLAQFRDDESTSYPASGSFCGFVIATCGLDAFKRIYVAPDPVAVAPTLLGKSLPELDAAWREYLKTR